MSLLEDTLRGESGTRAPIWIMRQAGRYLPEYLTIKEQSTFLEMTRNPALAAEITLQPLRRFPLDAAIIFADIMTPLEALGLEIEFSPGPKIARPLRSDGEIAKLHLRSAVAPFVGEALRIVRAELPEETALIGFAGAPLTLAAYLVEGSGSKDFENFRAFMRAHPASLHVLLGKLTEMSIAYLRMQIESGAQVIQLFDSWAGLHDPSTFREFAVPYNTRIMQAVGDAGAARIYFALGASHLIEAIKEIPAEAAGIDWRTDLRAARRALPGRTLQGNLDPAWLFSDRDTIAEAARHVLDEGLGGPHVFNLGHGIWPATPVDAVAHLVETVRGYVRAVGS